MVDSAPVRSFRASLSNAPLFFDQFLYPDGSIAGQGPWIANTFGDPDALVNDNQLQQNGNVPSDAVSLTAIASLDMNQPWQVTLRVTYAPASAGDDELGIVVQSVGFTGGAAVLNLRDSAGTGNPADITINLSTTLLGPPVTVPLNTPFFLTLSYDPGPLGTLTAAINGTPIGTRGSLVPWTAGPPSLQLFFDNAFVQSGFTVDWVRVSQL